MKKIVILVKKVQESKSVPNLAPHLHNRRYLFSRAKASNNAYNTSFLFRRVLSFFFGENPGDEGDQDVDLSLSDFLLLFCDRTKLQAFFLELLCDFTESTVIFGGQVRSQSCWGKRCDGFFDLTDCSWAS